jgi:GR25 family glycosyltransferase involved in LPS biosynthesis
LTVPPIVVAKDRHRPSGRGKQHGHGGGAKGGAGALGDVHNFLITCQNKAGSHKRRMRFEKLMNRSGLKFEVVPCVEGTADNVAAAVRDGLLGSKARHAYNGVTAQGHDRSEVMGSAISHLRLLKMVAGGNASIVNVFEDTEAILPNYKERRAELLANLPSELDIVKLNVKRPAGRKVNFVHAGRWLHVSVFRMHSSLSPTLNFGLNNYVVTRNGASKILKWSARFEAEGRWETWDQYLLYRFYKESKKRGSFVGFTVSTSVMSVSCPDNHKVQAELCKK